MQEFYAQVNSNEDVPYIAHLVAHNGGTLGGGLGESRDNPNNVQCFYSIIHGSNRIEDVLEDDYRPEGFLPIAEGYGAVEYCIKLADGAVYRLVYDDDDEPERIAESFTTFLSSFDGAN